MDATTLTADLFGAARRGAVTLRRPVEVRRAVLTTERSASCDGIRVLCDRPIQALCGALRASGLPDSPMQVVDPVGAAVMFVESVHAAALAGSRPT